MSCSRSPGVVISSGPHPWGKFRGIWLGGLRPTPNWVVEGDLARGGLQADTQGGSWEGSGQEGVSRPRPRGGPGPGGICSSGCLVWGQVPAPEGETLPPPDGYCCGRYASYWNAFLVKSMFRWKCLLAVVVHNSRIFSSFTEVACRERHGSVLTSWNKYFTFHVAFSYFGDKKAITLTNTFMTVVMQPVSWQRAFTIVTGIHVDAKLTASPVEFETFVLI